MSNRILYTNQYIFIRMTDYLISGETLYKIVLTKILPVFHIHIHIYKCFLYGEFFSIS